MSPAVTHRAPHRGPPPPCRTPAPRPSLAASPIRSPAPASPWPRPSLESPPPRRPRPRLTALPALKQDYPARASWRGEQARARTRSTLARRALAPRALGAALGRSSLGGRDVRRATVWASPRLEHRAALAGLRHVVTRDRGGGCRGKISSARGLPGVRAGQAQRGWREGSGGEWGSRRGRRPSRCECVSAASRRGVPGSVAGIAGGVRHGGTCWSCNNFCKRRRGRWLLERETKGFLKGVVSRDGEAILAGCYTKILVTRD